jgi:hypothetical protein
MKYEITKKRERENPRSGKIDQTPSIFTPILPSFECQETEVLYKLVANFIFKERQGKGKRQK